MGTILNHRVVRRHRVHQFLANVSKDLQGIRPGHWLRGSLMFVGQRKDATFATPGFWYGWDIIDKVEKFPDRRQDAFGAALYDL